MQKSISQCTCWTLMQIGYSRRRSWRLPALSAEIQNRVIKDWKNVVSVLSFAPIFRWECWNLSSSQLNSSLYYHNTAIICWLLPANKVPCDRAQIIFTWFLLISWVHVCKWNPQSPGVTQSSIAPLGCGRFASWFDKYAATVWFLLFYISEECFCHPFLTKKI